MICDYQNKRCDITWTQIIFSFSRFIFSVEACLPPFFLHAPQYYKAIFPQLCQSIIPIRLSRVVFPWYQALCYAVQGKFYNRRLSFDILKFTLNRRMIGSNTDVDQVFKAYNHHFKTSRIPGLRELQELTLRAASFCSSTPSTARWSQQLICTGSTMTPLLSWLRSFATWTRRGSWLLCWNWLSLPFPSRGHGQQTCCASGPLHVDCQKAAENQTGRGDPGWVFVYQMAKS